MRTITFEPDEAVIAFTLDDLVVLYGGLVESSEALSPAEFHARIGRDLKEAEALRRALKVVVDSLQKRQAVDQAHDQL